MSNGVAMLAPFVSADAETGRALPDWHAPSRPCAPDEAERIDRELAGIAEHMLKLMKQDSDWS